MGLLACVALAVDVRRDEVDAQRHEGEGEQGKQRQHRINRQHHRDHQRHQHHQVHGIHDGRAEVHPDVAHVFTDAVHQVARVVPFVEAAVQHLVMPVDVALEVVFHQAAHHNDGLPGQKREPPFDQKRQEVEHGLQGADPKHKVQDGLPRRGGVQPLPSPSQGVGQEGQGAWQVKLVHGGRFALGHGHQEVGVGFVQGVDTFPNHGGCPDGEHVGEDNENHAEEQPSSVLPNHGIQCKQRLHGVGARLRTRSSKTPTARWGTDSLVWPGFPSSLPTTRLRCQRTRSRGWRGCTSCRC